MVRWILMRGRITATATLLLVTVAAVSPAAARQVVNVPAALPQLVVPGARGAAQGGDTLAAHRYARAERLLGWNATLLVSGDEVDPQWMRGGNRFWYRNKTAAGAEFVLVDPERNTRSLLFDHVRLAAAMSLAADTAFDPSKLPFQRFELSDDERTIRFNAHRKGFSCDIAIYNCAVGDTLADARAFTRSPDGRWEAFVHEYDLYIRPVAGGDSIRLTHDGEEYWRYASSTPRPGQIIRPTPSRPILQWSPDSRRIAVQRMDERDVEKLPLYSVTSDRPRGFTYPYALPGDSIIPRFDIHIVEIDAGRNVRVQMEPQPYIVYGTTGMQDSTWLTVKWAPRGERLYFTHGTRGGKRIQLMEADAASGEARMLVRDTSSTYVELSLDIRDKPNWAVLNDGDDIIWFSERDGWAHLYRFGRDGRLKNRITEGAWTVGQIVHIDEPAGTIYFTARGREAGRNPAIADFYAVSMDGSGLRRLGGEHADHRIRATPSGRYFVDTFSRVDAPPVTVLRDRGGRVLRTLETADVSRLEEIGWRPPQPFVAKARDGITDVHGLIYLPSDFDPARKYPVVEYIYPGPFIGSVGYWDFNVVSRGEQAALAELGFIVVLLDHMGSPFRSKAFQDNYYGNMGDHGLPDHIAALKQLAAQYPSFDLTRVGIYGHSGGGFASSAAILQYPDFYHVAVSTAGNHDNRTYHAAYGEKYQGLLVRDSARGDDNYTSQSNYGLAANLRGRLFLMTGDMDDNVHPAMTMRLANELIRANRTFDLMVLPDRAHGLNEPYVIRRRWDYFVEHLLGQTPPRDYEIRRPAN